MEILNVIETSSGLISNVASFVIPPEEMGLNAGRNNKINAAEEYFLRVCTRLGYDENDGYIPGRSVVEDGYFSSGDRDVSLVWSVNVFK